LQVIGDLVVDLDVEDPPLEQAKLLKAVTEFDTYIRALRHEVARCEWDRREEGRRMLSTA